MLRLAIASSLAVCATAAGAAQINETSPNPPGSDPSSQTVELLGTPGAGFSGWLLSIESDVTTGSGTVDRAASISGTFDASGLLSASVPDLENPSFTLVLVDTFSGSAGSTDIDGNNDGIIDDLSSLGTVLDAIGVPDTNGEPLYGAQLGGADLAYIGREPELVFRDGITGALYSVPLLGGTEVFDAAGNPVAIDAFDLDPATSTFGAVNPTAVPVPAAMWLLGSAVLGLGSVARRRG